MTSIKAQPSDKSYIAALELTLAAERALGDRMALTLERVHGDDPCPRPIGLAQPGELVCLIDEVLDVHKEMRRLVRPAA